MCGRTCLTLHKEQIQHACCYRPKGKDTYSKPEWVHEHNDGKEYTPSYNIAPTDVTPVLISSRKNKHENDCEVILKPMMWGIIPPWHKGDYKNHNLSTNNCRLESIKTSKLYSPILNKGGRCIVVAEGFYEWQTTDKTSKVKKPYYIYRPQESEIKIDHPETWTNDFSIETGWKGPKLMYMAGVYSVWQNENKVVYSYSVITIEANDTLNWLHHRMPAILDSREQIEAWLDVDQVSADCAVSYLKPVKLLAWHQVSTIVNNSKNKSVDCNKKITDDKKKITQTSISSWFTKAAKRKSDGDISTQSKKAK